MRRTTFVKAAKFVSEKKENYCCYALMRAHRTLAKSEADFFHKIFKPKDASEFDPYFGEPSVCDYEKVKERYRNHRVIALLLAYEIARNP